MLVYTFQPDTVGSSHITFCHTAYRLWTFATCVSLSCSYISVCVREVWGEVGVTVFILLNLHRSCYKEMLQKGLVDESYNVHIKIMHS